MTDSAGSPTKAENIATNVAIDPTTSPNADLKHRIKQLVAQKGIVSRKIGESRKQGIDASELIDSMKVITTELKSLEAELNEAASGKSQKTKPQKKVFPARLTDSADESEPQPGESNPLSKITIIRASNSSIKKRWNTFVDNNSSATIYHRFEFKQLIEDTFGHETIYLYATDNSDNIVGVLPAIRTQSKLFGDYITSLPFFNYGGPISSHSSISEQLIAELSKIGSNLPVSHAELRESKPRPGYPAKTDKISMFLHLPDCEEELARKLGAKVRAQIKKGEINNFEFRLGGQELLPDFYRVFSRNMRDLGTPVYSIDFFQNILETLSGNASICVLYLNGAPCSCAFLIGYKDTMEIPWASTIKSANPFNANMVLYWNVLRTAINKGYSFFDFGRSSKDAATYKFKKQWGAEPWTLHWHYWLKDGGELPQLNPNNPKYKLLIAVWQRLPVFLTNIIGPYLVKNLP